MTVPFSPYQTPCSYCGRLYGYHAPGCVFANRYVPQTWPPIVPCRSCAELRLEIAKLREELLEAIKNLAPAPSEKRTSVVQEDRKGE